MNNIEMGDDLSLLRTPPHSVEAEQSVLGGLMLDNMAWDKINDIVHEDDFYRFDHRVIFKTIVGLMEKDHPADVLTVFESLQNQGRLDDVGGMSYLNALATGVSSAVNIRRYAEIVRDRSLLRKLISASDNIAESALSPQGRDTNEIIDSAEKSILQVFLFNPSNIIKISIAQLLHIHREPDSYYIMNSVYIKRFFTVVLLIFNYLSFSDIIELECRLNWKR